MLRSLFFTALLVTSVLADYGSSYTSYQSPQTAYGQPDYGYLSGNHFYAPPAQPYFPLLGGGFDWGFGVSAVLTVLVVALLVGGVVLAIDCIATYYSDFDSDIVFRALGDLPRPEVSQVISGIEKLQELYEAATKKKAD